MNNYAITGIATKYNLSAPQICPLKMTVSFCVLAQSLNSAHDRAMNWWKEQATSALEIISIIKIGK